MKRRYLAFDIETAKNVHNDSGDLMAHRPLGITCAAAVEKKWRRKATVFHSTHSDHKPAPKMTPKDLSHLVDFLLRKVDSGYTIVTLNGLGFDFDILAEESGRADDCRQLALGHVDMMFQVVCERGFPVGLDAAAKALGLRKSPDVDGKVAPQLWKDGEHDRVLDYVKRDCELTLKVAMTSEKKRKLYWISRRGKRTVHEIPDGWLTVEDAIELPLPDTSWMDHSWPREKFSGWLSLG